MKLRRGKRSYVLVTDPKTKKSVGMTVPGPRDEVLKKIEAAFASTAPAPTVSGSVT